MKIRFTNLFIADGSGTPPVPGEVLTEGCFIADAGPSVPHREDRVVDGRGLLLIPGFIDAHGHSDMSLPAAPDAAGKISQGITTEICGNCGLSVFPLTDRNREHLQELYAQYAIRMDWKDLTGYLTCLPENTLRLVPLCGHNTLRGAVAGYEKKRLSVRELDAMRKMLKKALDQGAAGLSSGLLYTPGCFAGRHEIEQLLEVVAEQKKIYALHLRSEGNELLESLEETSEAAAAAGLTRLMISHFKTAGKTNHHKLDAALDWFERTRNRGVRVWCDRYPWCESQTQLSVIVPEKFGIYDDSTLKKILQESPALEKLAVMLRDSGRDWSAARLVWTAFKKYQPDAGRKFSDIAEDHGIPAWQAASELLKEDPAGTTAAFCGMSPENLDRILQMDCCCCGTDESARPEDFRIGRSHPRGFGAMPRFFRMLCRQYPVGRVIQRMCTLPAEIFQLRDRGRIAPGLLADLVLLDPEKFDTDADFSSPHRFARGIHGVWIGGVKVR